MCKVNKKTTEQLSSAFIVNFERQNVQSDWFEPQNIQYVLADFMVEPNLAL